jgi:hypothetical protein
MDNQELYLYGTLLALAEEQSVAMSKLARRELGWWGKGRIQSRGREIGKFLQKISNHKTSKGSNNCSEDIRSDLAEIRSGNFPKNYSEEIFETLESYTANFHLG